MKPINNNFYDTFMAFFVIQVVTSDPVPIKFHKSPIKLHKSPYYGGN